MITENETCALFEFDDEKISTRMPDKLDVKLPKVAIMCFFKEVVKEYSKLDEVSKIMTVYHDIINWNYYEMECSALTACAKFRNKQFIELLYSGDLLNDVNNYNSRNWQFNNTAREQLFNICLELAFRLPEKI